ncbi:type I-E CRISPR-associated protein Cas5/CasD [Rhodococcus hoagii]|nr:type I-E CRISPR-associated protein Cas5/CasD [Prescottella equi]MBM4654113.1 type I-E CRISPR-associated protein Cas5/CasD [Prescottella equi]MBM4719587.1 type I-E CRISPR-associated protein Cas5/CasD [Prescottella equi]NKR23386.1 type I-E CRISPR-associated protein Cas5/CasD [Prescottella equi]NKT56003.1 type I-E CRISPR-associated protein Cas5/CasD [Prescottella equi]
MTGATVTFRLAGPQQAWSSRERRAYRPTQDHPTKSGIIGLVANALGRDRADDISDLAALQMGVRADRPGVLESDYHTSGSGNFPLLPTEVIADPALARAAAKNLPLERTYAAPKNVRRDGKGVLVGKRDAAVLTTDEYLADAAFTIALTGDHQIIDQIAAALAAPARSLHLGRKAYPLSAPPAPRVHAVEDPAAALAVVPALHSAQHHSIWIEERPGRHHATGDTQIIVDQPTRFDTRRTVARLESHRAATAPDLPDAAGGVDFFAPEEQP